jgi:hypothetical protein
MRLAAPQWQGCVMNPKFLIALSIISIVSGSAVALAMAFFYYGGAAGPSVTGLMFEGALLVAIGLFVLLNLGRIEALQEKYRGK